ARLVNTDDLLEERDAFVVGALKCVAPDDGSECAARVQIADFLQDLVGALRRAPRENDYATAAERRLNAVADAVRERIDGDLRLLDGLLCFGLFDVSRGRLDLDDVCAELTRDLRGVCRDVDRRLALFAETGPARIRPHDDRQALRLGFER